MLVSFFIPSISVLNVSVKITAQVTTMNVWSAKNTPALRYARDTRRYRRDSWTRLSVP